MFSACSSRPVRVEGTAMMPTFHDGDRILIDKNIKDLKRGDVIAFLYPKDTSKWYIKRVTGLPGETIEIRGGKVYINGQVLEETYVAESYNTSKSSFPPQVVAENNYFVLGDNRHSSEDSRYLGFITRKSFTGTVLGGR